MVRFLGLYAGDSRFLRCAVAKVQGALQGPSGPARARLGLGYYGGDEVLLVRKPVGQDLGLMRLMEHAMGNYVLIGLDDSPAPQFRLEGTPPYRYRNYLGLWAVGHVADKEFPERVLFNIPEYLKRDIKTEARGELMFHMFLSYLHDMGKLDARTLRVEVLVEALRSTFKLFPKLIETGVGTSLPFLAACVSNGEHMVAAASSVPLFLYQASSIEACPLCSDMTRSMDHDPRPVVHEAVPVVAIAHTGSASPPPGFGTVPDGTMVVVASNGEVTLTGF